MIKHQNDIRGKFDHKILRVKTKNNFKINRFQKTIQEAPLES